MNSSYDTRLLSAMTGMTCLLYPHTATVVFFQDYDEVCRLTHMKLLTTNTVNTVYWCRKKQESYFSKWTRLTEVKE